MKAHQVSTAVLLAIVSMIALSGCQNAAEQTPSESPAMIKTEEPDAMIKPDAMMEKSGSYKDYSVATIAAEHAAGNRVVLFFHAPWCPYCKAADAAFNANLKEIPAGVTVLKTDYDSNTELKKKYGVTYQHTFVQIDSNQDKVTIWNGGDIDNLKKYIKTI